jgi:hypothetical protein
MIHADLDSVALQWIGKGTLPGATFKGRKESLAFLPTFIVHRLIGKTTYRNTEIKHTELPLEAC